MYFSHVTNLLITLIQVCCLVTSNKYMYMYMYNSCCMQKKASWCLAPQRCTHVSLFLSQDLQKRLCPRTGKACTRNTPTCTQAGGGGGSWEVVGATPVWYAPTSLDDLFAIVSGNPDSSVRLVAGDTGRGECVPQPTLLYCITLHCTVLYCIVLCCTVLYYAVLCCTVRTVLYCTVLYCTVLHCIYCAVLYCAVLYCIVLYCTVLCCAALCICDNYVNMHVHCI